MKTFLFGKRCSLWYCFKKPWRYLQISIGEQSGTPIPYCERHARIADELFKENEIKLKVPHDYTPLSN